MSRVVPGGRSRWSTRHELVGTRGLRRRRPGRRLSPGSLEEARRSPAGSRRGSRPTSAQWRSSTAFLAGEVRRGSTRRATHRRTSRRSAWCVAHPPPPIRIGSAGCSGAGWHGASTQLESSAPLSVVRASQQRPGGADDSSKLSSRCADGRQLDPVRHVLVRLPARAQAEHDPAAAGMVERQRPCSPRPRDAGRCRRGRACPSRGAPVMHRQRGQQGPALQHRSVGRSAVVLVREEVVGDVQRVRHRRARRHRARSQDLRPGPARVEAQADVHGPTVAGR